MAVPVSARLVMLIILCEFSGVLNTFRGNGRVWSWKILESCHNSAQMTPEMAIVLAWSGFPPWLWCLPCPLGCGKLPFLPVLSLGGLVVVRFVVAGHVEKWQILPNWVPFLHCAEKWIWNTNHMCFMVIFQWSTLFRLMKNTVSGWVEWHVGCACHSAKWAHLVALEILRQLLKII